MFGGSSFRSPSPLLPPPPPHRQAHAFPAFLSLERVCMGRDPPLALHICKNVLCRKQRSCFGAGNTLTHVLTRLAAWRTLTRTNAHRDTHKEAPLCPNCFQAERGAAGANSARLRKPQNAPVCVSNFHSKLLERLTSSEPRCHSPKPAVSLFPGDSRDITGPNLWKSGLVCLCVWGGGIE